MSYFQRLRSSDVLTMWRPVGRPYMYGLACGGSEGVEQVCRSILADAEITLGLAGYSNLDEIRGKREEFMTQVKWDRDD